MLTALSTALYVFSRSTTSSVLLMLLPMPSMSSAYINMLVLKKLLGHTTLGKTVGRICKSAGITGYKTNHSLRATTTTRLYQSGVDEQLVMERTGHRSLDGVRSYKRTSDCQRFALSDILNKETSSLQPTRPVVPLVQSALSNQLLQGLSIPSATFSHCEVHFHVGSTGTATDVKTAEPPRKRRRAWIIDDSDSD